MEQECFNRSLQSTVPVNLIYTKKDENLWILKKHLWTKKKKKTNEEKSGKDTHFGYFDLVKNIYQLFQKHNKDP